MVIETKSFDEQQAEIKASALDLKAAVNKEMEQFLDVPITISTELGQTDMKVKDILMLKVGDIVELTKLVGEPMEIFINGLPIARGEVVVVNDKFGVRVTDVVEDLEIERSFVE